MKYEKFLFLSVFDFDFFLKFSWASHFDVFQDPIYISQDQLDKFLQIQPIFVNYSQWDSKMDSIIIQDVDTSKRIFKMDNDNAPSSVIYVIKKMSKHLCVILILMSLFGGFHLHFWFTLSCNTSSILEWPLWRPTQNLHGKVSQ